MEDYPNNETLMAVISANENGQIHTNTKYMDYVAAPEELRLGCYRSNVNGTGRFAKGILNDCRIYNIALTDEQLEEFLLN
jgi:hypothetical protein